MYTEITSGYRYRAIWMLLPVILAPLATILYCNRSLLLQRNWVKLLPLLPDILVLAGCSVLVFAIRLHPAGEYHPTWGDRSDGRRIRTLPPMNQVSPLHHGHKEHLHEFL